MLGFSPLAKTPLATEKQEAAPIGPVNVTVNLTGVSSTSGAGTITAITTQNVPATGLAATGQVGDAGTQISVPFPLIGSVGTNTEIIGDSTTGALGSLVGTGQVGSLVVAPLTPAAVTGVSSTTGTASVIIVIGSCTVFPTGVTATGETNPAPPPVWGEIIPAPGTNWNNIAA